MKKYYKILIPILIVAIILILSFAYAVGKSHSKAELDEELGTSTSVSSNSNYSEPSEKVPTQDFTEPVYSNEAPASSEKSSKEVIAERRKSAKSIAYKELAHYPDKYKGQVIKISGKVVQSLEESGFFTLRVAQDDNYDNMILVEYVQGSGDARVIENDEVVIYGIYSGTQSYQSTLGGTITIPAMESADLTIK